MTEPLTPAERARAVTVAFLGDDLSKSRQVYRLAGMIEEAIGEAVAAEREPQSCGHPRACIVSSDEGTHYCGWCESLVKEMMRCVEIARGFALEYESHADEIQPPSIMKIVLFRKAKAAIRIAQSILNSSHLCAVSESAPIHTCADCGTPLQAVRPGKWQCPRCD